MNRDQAKEVLATWKPGASTHNDSELATALDLAANDPELKSWLEAHQSFQTRVRDTFRSLPVPATLPEAILAKSVRPRLVRLPVALLAAAAILVLGLIWVTLATRPREAADFKTLRSRMVRTVLREYRMDVVTNDLASIRGFLSQHQAPADFQLPPPLLALQPVGGGLLSWQGQPVSMVCLDGRSLGMLYLFIVPTRTLHEIPPTSGSVEQVNKLGTLSWSRGDQAYILAAAAPLEELQKLL